MRRLIAGVAALLTAVAFPAATGAQALADTLLPQQPPIVVELPVASGGTVDTLQRLLVMSGAPFGLEHAPPQVESEGEYSRTPTGIIAANGLPLRKALNRIAAADPRYGWQEANGRILVRSIAGRGPRGFLQRIVPVLELDRASVQTALESIARAAIRRRPPAGIATGAAGTMTSVGAGIPTLSESEPEPYVSVSLRGATVLQALDAVANAHGRLSWVVRYETADGHDDGVSVTFITPHHTITAISMAAMQSRRPTLSGPRVLIPAGDIEGALRTYSLRTRVPVGLERIESAARTVTVQGAPPLDVTGVPPAVAVERILELDSRYEAIETSGLVNVRPRRDLVPRSPLDAPIAEFHVKHETVDRILTRIVRMLGGTGSASGYGPPVGGDKAEVQADHARSRRHSLSLRNTTVREVLNRLCEEAGALSWIVNPEPARGGGANVRITLVSPDRWGSSASFHVAEW